MSKRPAEVGGIAGAVALLLAHLLGVDDATTIVALSVIVGFIPAAITWLVVTLHVGPEAPPDKPAP